MTTQERLASLIRRCNRKTLALALGTVLALTILAHGIDAVTYTPAHSGPALVQTSGASASGDARDSVAPATYMPSVDDLTGNTVIYDDGTGDQMDYVPPFDPGS
jgi:hypothetical protein